MTDLFRENIIPRAFFDTSPVDVAKQILGKYLVRATKDSLLVGKIVETEAYLPFSDPAAHNFRGKTARNRSLFQSAGHAYVHSMRQYCLLDIVTEGAGSPGSVLIRAVEPIEGIEIMFINRRTNDIFNLCSGPGKLCQAFTITKDFDGIDMTAEESVLFTADIDPPLSPDLIVASPRIGITKSREKPLRFTEKDSPYVSQGPRKK